MNVSYLITCKYYSSVRSVSLWSSISLTRPFLITSPSTLA
jgi:hypothetical protein